MRGFHLCIVHSVVHWQVNNIKAFICIYLAYPTLLCHDNEFSAISAIALTTYFPLI